MPMPLPLHGASMLHVENECFPIKDIFRNSAKRIYPFEIKKVRRITSFSGKLEELPRFRVMSWQPFQLPWSASLCLLG